MQWQPIQAIFKGLKVGVILLLINAIIKLKKGVKVNFIGVTLFVIALALMILSSIFNWQFRYLSLCLIAFGILVGVTLTKLGKLEGGKKE